MMLSDMFLNNLPVLQVIIPLLGALVSPALPSGRAPWLWATAITWLSFMCTAFLVTDVNFNGTQSYHLGGWAPPIGIEYRIDIFNAYVLAIIAGVSSISILFARDTLQYDVTPEKHGAFYAVYLLCLAGMLGIVSTNDVFNIYVFLEISSLTTYTLIAMGRNRRALSASFKYLIIGTLGATFILIGIGLLYMMTGTLNLTDMANLLKPLTHTRPVLAAFAFIVVGLIMKMALFPLHMWLPNAYAHSPSFVSVFLSSTATKVSVYVLIRIIYSLFGYEFSLQQIPLDVILLVLGSCAILVGSAAAIYQPNVKKMLAYSSVAQMGYIAVGIGMASQLGLTAAIVHIANHAMAKAALFMAAGALAYRIGRVKISSIEGLGKQMPLTMLGFTFAGMSLIGVPLTAGFISKWYLLTAAYEQGMWYIIVVILLSSVMALMYIGKVLERAYFSPTHAPKGEPLMVQEAPLSLLLPLWILVGLNFYFGIDADFTAGIASDAAAMLMNRGMW